MLPRFVMGHNALIGVNHVSRADGGVKAVLSDEDRTLLDAALDMGVKAIVLDNHPVALQAAHHLRARSRDTRILPMVPYAQGEVDRASRSGLVGLAKDMAKTSTRMGLGGATRAAAALATWKLPRAGAEIALAHYLEGFPKGVGPVVFQHNAVTDLLMGWEAHDALRGFAQAARGRGLVPGFVTLNPGRIPALADVVGRDAWFMAAVNSRGIQMSPSQAEAERALQDAGLNVIAMSVLAGGVLKPEDEIPRALRFPAVKSVVVGTSKVANLTKAHALAEATA